MSDLANRFKNFAPIMPGCACESCMMLNEVWVALSASESTEGAVAKLREALILSGRAVGASLSNEVSNEFLLFVPSEVELVVARLNREVAALRAMPRQDGSISSHQRAGGDR